MTHRRMYALAALAVCCAGIIAGVVLLSWRRPSLGPESGRLRTCPGTPNCVCSQDADPEHQIAPLVFTGDPEAAWQRVRQVVAAMPGASLTAQHDDYLHVEFATPVLRFIDDLELLLDAGQGRIQVRSASRVGRSDLGVNRRRVEELRRRFAAAVE